MADVHSLSPTLDAERTASPGGVGLIWLAATMTASTLPLGALIVELFPHANFLWVLLFASLFFVTVGVISLPGFRLGIPTMAISARLFGEKFNRLISISNWFSQVGWQAVVLVLVIFVLRSVLEYLHVAQSSTALTLAIILGVLANFAVPVIGYAAIVRVQSLASLVMGMFALYILWHLHGFALLWSHSFAGSKTSWLQTFAALSLTLMGGALSWTMFASDYSRYLARSSTRPAVFFWPALGGAVGGALILSLAMVLSFSGGVNLSARGLTLAAKGMDSPALYLAFCVFAILGLLASNFLNSYSSAFSLAVTLGRDLNRKYVTILDAVLATLLAFYVLFVSPSFFEAFQTFLDLLIIVAAPWTGIVCIAVLFRQRLGKTAISEVSTLWRIAILLVGVLATIVFSNNPLWEGWGAQLLSNYDLSPLIGFAFGAGLELARQVLCKRREAESFTEIASTVVEHQ
ncbi:cytosine permease [Acidithiobacillus sp. IBUN Pt1247-S3]|uniref:purine-cytosine permease family protein n=1 Tax=Acidithiobacillus sp. IBUN Pt1247-S3 TaxID=3166642 RepID=UPI0034E50CDF